MNMIDCTMNNYGISPLPEVVVEAMAYVPFQPNAPKTYGALQGFEAGTMFPTLDKPWYGRKCGGCDRND